MNRRFGALGLLLVFVARPFSAAQERPQVRSLKITVLSTMLAGDVAAGIGEWGFAALVEADGRRILFDTGARPDTVRANVKELGIDLSGITDLIISHNHSDHTGGLLTLRSAFGGDGGTLARSAPIHAAVGGFHLFAASDDHLAWTTKQLKGMGLQHFLGAHCTGIEAVFRVREQCSLPRSAAIGGSIGAIFELGEGIRPTSLAR